MPCDGRRGEWRWGGRQVEDLARLSFRRQPLYVGIDDARAASTREGLEQGYCCVASDKRFLLLFTFLKKNANRKVPPADPLPRRCGRLPACCMAPGPSSRTMSGKL